MSGILGFLGFVLGAWALHGGRALGLTAILGGRTMRAARQERASEALFLLVSIAVPMFLFGLFESFRDGNAPMLLPRKTLELSLYVLSASVLRVIGAFVTFAAVCSMYWLFDEYHASFCLGALGIDEEKRQNGTTPFHYPFFRCFALVGARHCAFAVVAYVIITELRARLLLGLPEHDGYWATGLTVLGILEDATAALSIPRWLSTIFTVEHLTGVAAGGMTVRARLVQHSLECLVRGFFGPLMFSGFCENLANLPPQLLTPCLPLARAQTTAAATATAASLTEISPGE